MILNGAPLGQTAPVPVGGTVASTGTPTALVSGGLQDVGVSDFVLTYLGSTPPFGGTDPSPLSQDDLLLNVGFSPVSVPEPSTLAALGTALGILGLGICHRRMRR